MSRIITLEAQTCGFDYDKSAEGFVTKSVPSIYYWDGELKIESYEHTFLPELGPKQIIKGDGPLVVEIKGRRFKVEFQSDSLDDEDCWNDYGDMPEPGTVVFTEVGEDTPLTETEVWDGEKITRDRLEALRRELLDEEKAAVKEPEERYWQESVQWTKSEIALYEAKVEHKDWSSFSPNKSSIFGQPSFIQNEIMPVVNGRAAFHLATFETGWGDSGNENYLVALDDDGYPCAVFWEASCC